MEDANPTISGAATSTPDLILASVPGYRRCEQHIWSVPLGAISPPRDAQGTRTPAASPTSRFLSGPVARPTEQAPHDKGQCAGNDAAYGTPPREQRRVVNPACGLLCALVDRHEGRRQRFGRQSPNAMCPRTQSTVRESSGTICDGTLSSSANCDSGSIEKI